MNPLPRLRQAAQSVFRYIRSIGTDPIPELEHLPFTALESLKTAGDNRDAAGKIRQEAFRENLVIVVGMPKAASSLIGTSTAKIGQDLGLFRGGRRYARYMTNRPQTSQLRPELVRDFPYGGVMKYHTNPKSENIETLSILGAKHLLVLRHPLDALVATCCHFRGDEVHDQAYDWDAVGENEAEIVPNMIYPVQAAPFRKERPVDEGLDHLIEEGYLQALLSWTTDWLRFRSRERSLVVRYEDFFTDTANEVERIARFLEPQVASTLVKKMQTAIAEDIQPPDRDDDEKYPRGWTGKIGTWRNYLSDDQKAAYDRVVDAFERLHPRADLLRETYPDLAAGPGTAPSHEQIPAGGDGR